LEHAEGLVTKSKKLASKEKECLELLSEYHTFDMKIGSKAWILKL
jgi:hypothetical protein